MKKRGIFSLMALILGVLVGFSLVFFKCSKPQEPEIIPEIPEPEVIEEIVEEEEEDSALITSVSEINSYLSTMQGGFSPDNPVVLPLAMNLGNMAQDETSWQNLLTVINNSGRFVNLDLSGSVISSTEFNPGSSIAEGKSRIVSISLPDTTTRIASGIGWDGTEIVTTFAHFDNLESFSAPALTSIGDYAFYHFTNLTMTRLPPGITSIGSYAFSGCTNLTITRLPAGITTIGDFAFSYCTDLALTELPARLVSIGHNAFAYCTNLAVSELPEGLVSIGSEAFYNCTSIVNLTIPQSVMEIGSRAFENWTREQTIYVKGRTQGEADTAWGIGWRAGINANIVYLD